MPMYKRSQHDIAQKECSLIIHYASIGNLGHMHSMQYSDANTLCLDAQLLSCQLNFQMINSVWLINTLSCASRLENIYSPVV